MVAGTFKYMAECYLQFCVSISQSHSSTQCANCVQTCTRSINSLQNIATQLRNVPLSVLCTFSKCLGVDYGTPNQSTFTFTAAQSIQCTNIPITDDTLIEGPVDEMFNMTLTQILPNYPGVQLAPTTAIVSIEDNDGK